MKLQYQLSQLALEDLDQIWLFTFENWSKSQANKYYKELFNTINMICLNPQIGRSISDIKSMHRITESQSHIIVYKELDQVIYIDRILHKRMDINNALIE